MPFLDPDFFRLAGYVVLFLLVAPLFPFIYVVLRWRTGDGREPGMGTYSGLLYFRSAGILLALAGAANLTYGWISTTKIDEEMTRLSWGMLVGSALFLAINLGLLRLWGSHPGLATARRVFNGFVMIMAGLVAFTMLVSFCVWMFAAAENEKPEGLRAEQLKVYGSWTFYYLTTYLLTTYLMWRGTRSADPGVRT